jgi:hypothetical protein
MDSSKGLDDLPTTPLVDWPIFFVGNTPNMHGGGKSIVRESLTKFKLHLQLQINGENIGHSSQGCIFLVYLGQQVTYRISSICAASLKVAKVSTSK